MARYRISKEHVWGGVIPDRPGALAEKLQALAAGGLNLELIIGRRDWEGQGIMFISPLRTLEEIEIAERAGLAPKDNMVTLRIEGPNEQGLAAKIAGALAAAGINVHGYSAAAIGERCVTNVAFDNDSDTARAREVLLKLLG
ncbi:MAG: hypothetical protein AB1716_14770 [Planctomycetota bacterium]